jgi:hypothetical protein
MELMTPYVGRHSPAGLDFLKLAGGVGHLPKGRSAQTD